MHLLTYFGQRKKHTAILILGIVYSKIVVLGEIAAYDKEQKAKSRVSCSLLSKEADGIQMIIIARNSLGESP